MRRAIVPTAHAFKLLFFNPLSLVWSSYALGFYFFLLSHIEHDARALGSTGVSTVWFAQKVEKCMCVPSKRPMLLCPKKPGSFEKEKECVQIEFELCTISVCVYFTSLRF